jgi:hypothetical protein
MRGLRDPGVVLAFGDNHSNKVYYNCFNTLCEAVAAGYSQCTTQSHNIPCDSGVALSERH